MEKAFKLIGIMLMMTVAHLASAQLVSTFGVKINVSDLAKASEFYCDKLGFQIESSSDMHILLKNNDKDEILLQKVPEYLPEREKDASATFTLQVNDLDTFISAMQAKGFSFDEKKRKEAVGYAIFARDPFGKKVSFMHQTIVATEPFDEPKIYNYGFLVPDMQKAIEFYSGKLGFVQRSQRYLPYDMPLGHADNSFGFMIHYREGIESIQHKSSETQHVVIMFKTNDLAETTAKLKSLNIQLVQKDFRQGPLGKYISFVDPFGYISDVVEVKD